MIQASVLQRRANIWNSTVNGIDNHFNDDIDNYDDNDNNNDYDDDEDNNDDDADLPGRPHWAPHPVKLLHCSTGLTIIDIGLWMKYFLTLVFWAILAACSKKAS